MSPTHLRANLEIIPNFSVSNPRSHEIASLYLNEAEGNLERLDDELSLIEGSTVVAALDNQDKVIAVAALKRMQDVPEGIITTVATRKEHHRKSLGAQVMSKVAEVAAQEGMTRLHVFPAQRSRAFYESQSFKNDPQRSFNPSWVTRELH
jgi:N-acetylglutamate synthase-like GNAT family acetyltransferase